MKTLIPFLAIVVLASCGTRTVAVQDVNCVDCPKTLVNQVPTEFQAGDEIYFVKAMAGQEHGWRSTNCFGCRRGVILPVSSGRTKTAER